MTEDEFGLYQKIVKSYSTATNNGADMFIDLFETDGRGVIIYLKPPSKYRTSMEVFLFLMSLMQHQHLRLFQDQVDDLCGQVKKKMEEIDEKLQKLSERQGDKL